MKTIMELKEKKSVKVTIDKTLDKYDNKILFPKKVERANEMLSKFGMPNLHLNK